MQGIQTQFPGQLKQRIAHDFFRWKSACLLPNFAIKIVEEILYFQFYFPHNNFLLI